MVVSATKMPRSVEVLSPIIPTGRKCNTLNYWVSYSGAMLTFRCGHVLPELIPHNLHSFIPKLCHSLTHCRDNTGLSVPSVEQPDSESVGTSFAPLYKEVWV
jgi:hypothetical protein